MSKQNKVKLKVIRGISVLLIREFMLKVFSIVGQLVLVRILAPEFFGVYAIIAFIVSIVELFTQLGVSTAMIQKKGELSDIEITSLLSLRMAVSILGIVAIYLLSPFLVKLYPALDDANQFLVVIFSLTLLVKPVKNTIISLLERELKYENITKIDGLGMIAYYFFAIIFALLQFSVLSFILAVLLKEIIETVLSFYYRPIKLRPDFNYKKVKKLIHFGLTVQAGNFLSFINISLIPLVGGRLLASQQIGYLVWSRNISSLPNSILDNYGRAAFSGMVRIQDDIQLISKAINKSIIILNIFIFFFFVMIFPYLYEFIHFIVSDQWLPAGPALTWFLLGSLFAGSIVPLGQGIIAIGKVKELTLLSSIITSIELIIAFALVTSYGFVGIAVAFFLNALMQFVGFSILARKVKITLAFGRQIFIILIIAVICYLFALFLNHYFDLSFKNYILKLLITAGTFWILCAVVLRNEVFELLRITKSALKNE